MQVFVLSESYKDLPHLNYFDLDNTNFFHYYCWSGIFNNKNIGMSILPVDFMWYMCIIWTEPSHVWVVQGRNPNEICSSFKRCASIVQKIIVLTRHLTTVILFFILTLLYFKNVKTENGIKR